MSNKKVAILIFGTSVAQLITIGFTPLLSRIYNPDDFGLFALLLQTLAYILIVTFALLLRILKYYFYC